MEQNCIEKQVTKKDWHMPSMEVVTSEELKKLIYAGACSSYSTCEVIWIRAK